MKSKSSSLSINAVFSSSAYNFDQLPCDDCSEIAFLGRSNCGKSSLLNRVIARKSLAYVSRHPGRTATLNSYTIDNVLRLVDMPGYGFARTSKKQRAHWSSLTQDYLMHRENLSILLVLIDARRSVTASDLEIFELVKKFAIPTRIVCTKTDLINQSEREKVENDIEQIIKYNAALIPEISWCSSRTGDGIAELQQIITNCLVLQR